MGTTCICGHCGRPVVFGTWINGVPYHIECTESPDKSMNLGACGNHCEACARRDDEIERLRAKLAGVEKALQFYADSDNHQMKQLRDHTIFVSKVVSDGGCIARKALENKS